eukprot:8871966-Pyramimonas_sp.AAC.1
MGATIWHQSVSACTRYPPPRGIPASGPGLVTDGQTIPDIGLPSLPSSVEDHIRPLPVQR